MLTQEKKSPKKNQKQLLKSDISNKEDKKISGKKRLLRKLEMEEREQIRNALSEHFLFKDKSANIINSLINKIELIELQPSSILFKEGSPGDCFYIIKQGRLAYVSENNSKEIKEMRQGDTFGELALLEYKNRTGTVYALEYSVCFSLDGEVFRNIVWSINQQELKERLNFISIVPVFRSLDSITLNAIASNMFKCTFERGHIIFKQGEKADALYIIKEGRVECNLNGTIIRILKEKDYFGEYAVLFNIPRSLTVNSRTKLTCYKIPDTLLEETLGTDFRDFILKSILRESFNNSSHLKIVNSNQIDKLYKKSEIKLYKNGEIVIPKGTFSEENLKLYTIICGNLTINLSSLTSEDKQIEGSNEEIIGKRGELFGESLIKPNFELKENIKAQGELRVIEFKWTSILQLLDFDNLGVKQNSLAFFVQWDYMRKTNLFRNTSGQQLMKICALMTTENFKADEFVFKEGTIGNKFYLIKSGKVRITKEGRLVREMEVGSSFGELALLSNEVRSASVKTVNDSSFFVLTKENFVKIIDKNMREYLNGRMALLDNFNMSLSDLFFIRTLGKGKFGSVSLVHNKKNLYAIKAVSRKIAEKQKILIKYFLDERKVLLKLDHQFIMKLVRTFKSDEYVFYLCEFIDGIGFGKYLEKKDNKEFLNLEETRFYLAFLFVVVDYLNSKQIVHRDIKPDNIMINSKGYLQLVDFGTSKQLTDFTFTVTGTPHYIAPEVLIDKGYNYSCDYWSIGIIAFEIYYNFYPFGNEAKDPIEVYKEIIRKKLILPNKGDPIMKDFIKNLLEKKVSRRLRSLDTVKSHALYKKFPWGELIDYKMEAPYKPPRKEKVKFEEYQRKYLDFLDGEREKLKKKMGKKSENEEKVISDYEEDGGFKYDTNWADEF